MFTGIVQALLPIQAVEHEADITRLTLDMGGLTDGLSLGASVAINGTCLTVTKVDQASVTFDVIMETRRTTNLGDVQTGDLVNVERSFKVGDEVGGHIVSGHVTGTASVIEQRVSGNDHVTRFSLAPEFAAYVMHKGFIAVDGASLTVSQVDAQKAWFEISLIPETLARTTLGKISIGDIVNVEVDSQTVATVETVERVLADEALRARLLGADES